MCIANVKTEKIYTDAGNNVEVDVYTLIGVNKLSQWQIRYCDLGEADVDLKEIGKSRPCIIVQTDKYNDDPEATVFVLPLSASPMYNIVSERLIGIRLNGKISILCFNEMKPINKSCVQNNIIADDIPDDIKELIVMGLYSEEEAKAKCAVGGNNRERRMVILKPDITYVGQDDERKPTVAFEEGKYEDSDLYFYAQALNDAGVEVDDTDNNDSDSGEVSEEDDLLAMLDNM